MSKSNLSVGTKAWAERINAAWQSSVDGILKTCKLLAEAKKVLGKGEFANMMANELTFHKSTASRLLLIGQDTRLVSHAKLLPPSWNTLYELTRLTDEELARAIEANKISPDMERSDVPREPRNLSAKPPRPPKTIEGTATEVEPAALPMPETPQPEPKASEPPPSSIAPDRFEEIRVHIETVQKLKELQRAVTRLEAENAKLRESPLEPPEEPPFEVQPFGSGDAITVTFVRNRPDVNFWQALLVALGEWSKLGSLGGLVPVREDTDRELRRFDVHRFASELIGLDRVLRDARNVA